MTCQRHCFPLAMPGKRRLLREAERWLRGCRTAGHGGTPGGHRRLWGISRLFAPCSELPRGFHAPGSFLTGGSEVTGCQEWVPGPERLEVNGSIGRSALWIPPPARQGAQPAPARLSPSPLLSEVNWEIKRGGGRDQFIPCVCLRCSDSCRNDPCPSLCIHCL